MAMIRPLLGVCRGCLNFSEFLSFGLIMHARVTSRGAVGEKSDDADILIGVILVREWQGESSFLRSGWGFGMLERLLGLCLVRLCKSSTTLRVRGP